MDTFQNVTKLTDSEKNIFFKYGLTWRQTMIE